MIDIFAFRETQGRARPDNRPSAGYTPGVKNGQHSEQVLRPHGSMRGWLAAVTGAAALVLAPSVAAAAGPDDLTAAAQSAQAALEKLRAAAEQATAAVTAGAPTTATAEARDARDDAAARAQRGVVTIERGGQVLGLGSVLANDGRIVTALSTLGSGNDLVVRYADGTTARAKVGHHDRTWDLALLVPQTGKWQDGLLASSKDPVQKDTSVHTFTASRGKPASSTMALRSHRALLGADDRRLDDVLEIGSRVSPTDLGAPILDEDGKVAGMVGRGCQPAGAGRPCTPVAYGVPVSAIRSFLRTVPATAVQPTAWLGIQGLPESNAIVRGVRVALVHPQSPAEQAQLHGGSGDDSDLIVALDGVPVTSPDVLAELVKKHAIGEKVNLLLFSNGRFRDAEVTLREPPDPSATPPGKDEDEPAAAPPSRPAAPARAANKARARRAAPEALPELPDQ